MESVACHKPNLGRRIGFVLVCIVCAVVVLLVSHLLTTSAVPASVVDISITGAFPNFSFSPSVITVTAGTIVRWTNNTTSAHTSTSDFGSTDPWDSSTIFSGDSFTRTFNISGTFTYHCEIHPSMQATVIVIGPPLTPRAYLPVVSRQ